MTTPTRSRPSGSPLALALLLLVPACDSGASSTTFPGGGLPSSSSRIGDLVWHDRNRDGLQQPDEPGIAGVRLGLFDAGGFLGTTLSDADGHYEFENLPAGTYRIEIAPATLPPLGRPAICNAGADDARDNDCAPTLVVLPDGQTDDPTVDFGFHSTLLCFGFDTEDDCVTPLVNGQDIQSGEEFGILFTVDGFPASGLEAAIFDSDPSGPNAGSSDPDLLVNRGNLLILQEDPQQTVPGIYDRPDDDASGGELRFGFLGVPCLLRSIDLVDICPDPAQGVEVVLEDTNGRRRRFTVPDGWTEDIALDGPPGFRTLGLFTLADQPGFASTAFASEDPGFDPLGVLSLRVHLGGSGAVDKLIFAPDLLAFAGLLRGAPSGTAAVR